MLILINILLCRIFIKLLFLKIFQLFNFLKFKPKQPFKSFFRFVFIMSSKLLNLKKQIPTQQVIVIAIVCLLVGAISASILITPASNQNTQTNFPSKDAIKAKMEKYFDLAIKLQGGDEYSAKVSKIEETNPDLYTLYITLYKGDEELQSTSVSVSKNGKYIIQYDIDDAIKTMEDLLNQQQKQKEEEKATVKKADKPEIELFVMSYCPYGLQMEKAILPVLEKLKDKIDFKLRFVNYAMHGEKEVWENTRQYCIQKQEPDKLYQYLTCFAANGDSNTCLTQSNLNKTQIDKCMEEADKEFKLQKAIDSGDRFPEILIDDALNKKYDVRGSPTLIINGSVVNVKRTPQNIAEFICSSFTNQPEECSASFSNSAPSPGFGTATGTASGGQCS